MAVHLAWLGAFAVTVIVIAIGRRVAPRIGLVDSPDERKKHIGDVPLIGGIGIFIGITTVLLISGQYVHHLPYIAAAFLLVSTGTWDDVKGLSPYLRLGVQALAVAVIAVLGDAQIRNLGYIAPDGGLLELGRYSIPFTIVAGVGLINAFNMCDGLDGLCGSLALAALVGILAMAASMGTHHVEVRFLLVVSACVAAFLLFNFPFPGRSRALAFLGDAGSYLIGLSILYSVIRLTQKPEPPMPPVAALWFCLLPLLDMGGIMFRRLMRRRSPFNPDREHLHHVFALARFSPAETTGAMAMFALTGVAVGSMLATQSVPDLVLMTMFLGVAGVYLWFIVRSWQKLRFLNRSIDRRRRSAGQGPVIADRRRRVVPEVANDDFFERRKGVIDRRRATAKTDTDAEEFPVVVQKSNQASGGISAGQSS